MTGYKIILIYKDGLEECDEDIYDSEEEAEENAAYLCSCYMLGGEILHMSNPGEYDDPTSDDRPTYKIVEVNY